MEEWKNFSPAHGISSSSNAHGTSGNFPMSLSSSFSSRRRRQHSNIFLLFNILLTIIHNNQQYVIASILLERNFMWVLSFFLFIIFMVWMRIGLQRRWRVRIVDKKLVIFQSSKTLNTFFVFPLLCLATTNSVPSGIRTRVLKYVSLDLVHCTMVRDVDAI